MYRVIVINGIIIIVLFVIQFLFSIITFIN